MLKLFVLINLCSLVVSFLINFPLTKMITINTTASYFGYSLLLQRGSTPMVIVGAPRKKRGTENTGSVFKCNLNNLLCEEYDRISRVQGVYPKGKNGDLIGSVLEGEDIVGGKFFTCAPRFVTIHGNIGRDFYYYTNGRCFYIKDSLNVHENFRLIQPLSSESQITKGGGLVNAFYNAAYGEAGFDLAYIKEENELLIGTPGKSLWNGGTVKTSIISYKSDVFSKARNLVDVVGLQDQYLGYAVSWGKFLKNSRTIWFVAGSPRGNKLLGTVDFYDHNRPIIRHTLIGYELGSYFGASLLVIHKNGGGDDILIGAPMSSGSSWDEGCVYYYKNRNDGSFDLAVKLSRKKTASRFGTVMATIGDIDLDSFEDCAISAPYEDGTGAVYLYFGSKDGFSDDRFYRISPSDFSTAYPKTVVKGFGLGISNGNDIDANKHNDIVIGAYESGQIFYFPTKDIFDVTMNVTSNLKIIYTSTTNFSVTYCITFKFRNGNPTKMLDFFTRVILDDDRILNRQNITKVISMKANDLHCMSEAVLLKKDHLNVEPLLIPYGYKLNESIDQITRNIFNVPVSYECGTDNVCQTNLGIKSTTPDISKIVFGVNSLVKVNVTISNTGESAYQTKLYIKVLPEISLINLRECDFENGTYVCLVARVLNGETEKSFLFDLANLQPRLTNLPINLKVESIGRDVNTTDNEVNLQIPIGFQNYPHIDSRSLPESVFLNKSENIVKITHSFLVGNYGPSPLDLNVTVLVPQATVNGSSVLEIKNIEGSVDGMVSKCDFSGVKPENLASLATIKKENDSKVLNCVESLENCISFLCPVGYMPKSNKNAVFTVKLIVQIKPAIMFLDKINKLVVISSAYFTNGTSEFFASGSTLLFAISDIYYMPLWIYIISVIAGLLLLLLLIYVLYKCNFFRRSYKERIENEQSLRQDEQLVEDNDDEEL